MIQVIGAPELLLRVNTAISYREVSVDSILPSLISTLQKCSVLPETNKNQMYPIDVFTHYEVEGYKTIIQTVQSDLSLLQRRSKGEIITPSHYDDVIHSMNRDRVPQLWLAQTFPSCSSLTKWIKELPVKIQIMSALVNDPSPVAYNLSMFLRPDRFIEAIKQTFARKHFVDINSVEFELQVRIIQLKNTRSIPGYLLIKRNLIILLQRFLTKIQFLKSCYFHFKMHFKMQLLPKTTNYYTIVLSFSILTKY